MRKWALKANCLGSSPSSITNYVTLVKLLKFSVLSFLINKVGMNIILPLGVLIKIEYMNICKILGTVPDT